MVGAITYTITCNQMSKKRLDSWRHTSLQVANVEGGLQKLHLNGQVAIVLSVNLVLAMLYPIHQN